MEDLKEIIKNKCYERAYKLYGKELPVNIQARLDLELNSIINNNFEIIYLIYSEVVKYSNKLGYKTGSGASVGNSFVAYLLEITNINPFIYNLPFELFAGTNYDIEPYIVINFSDNIQYKIFEYLQESFGKYLELYKFNFINNKDLTMLHELEKETKTNSDDIDLNDEEIINLLTHANDKLDKINVNGITEFEINDIKEIIGATKPQNFNDFVCTLALANGRGTWLYNADDLIKKGKKVTEVISNRDDMYNYLYNKGIEKDIAYNITTFVRKGKAFKAVMECNADKECKQKWNEYKEIMKKHNISEWYIKSAEKIKYMIPKSQSIDCTIRAFKIAWYKIEYPEAFYKVYSKR